MVPFPTDGLKGLLDKFAAPVWADDDPLRLALDADLEPDHTARLIDQLVAELDVRPLLDSYSGRGRKPHRPDLLLRVVLFEMHAGRQSPSEWADDLRHHAAVRWLARGLRPALSVLYEFRDRLTPFVDEWHQQIVAKISTLCPEVADNVTLDGTTLEANASRHKMARLETVEKHRVQLEQAQAAAAQPEANGKLPSDCPEWIAKTPARRQEQIDRRLRAKERLHEMHERNERRPKDKRLPARHVRVSLTDPEAASGRDKHGVYRPLYNVQYVWSVAAHVILAYGVFTHPGDHGMLPIMVEKMLATTGLKPELLLVDSAYTTPADLAFCDLHGIEIYGPWQANDYTKDRPAVQNPAQIPKTQFRYEEAEDVYYCPEGHAMPLEGYKYKPNADGVNLRYKLYRCPAEHCQQCPLAARCAKLPDKGRTVQRHPEQTRIDQHQERMQTPEAQAQYRQRGEGERPFADMKTHRNLRRINGRGTDRAKTQTGLTVLIHNLKALETLRNPQTKRDHPQNPCKIPA
jgi:transposase